MSWTSPFSLPGKWFKGNLHTHTTQSDGQYTPEQAIAWYHERGYDFLAITDHWVLTPGQVVAPDFITITGAELHGAGYHMLGLGFAELPNRDLEDSPQAIADAILSQDGLAYFAHPYWTGQTSADVATVPEIMGIEVFNAVCEVAKGIGFSSVHWDELLAQGFRFTALAVDDVHWRYNAQGQGFVMVRADRLDEACILDAIRRGQFYASTGPRIQDLRIVQLADDRLALRVHCSPCASITFFARGPRGQRFEAAPGESLDSAVYPIDADQGYLRVECRDARGRIAWSNPVFVQDVLRE